MSTLVLDQETEMIPIGEMLRTASGPVIEIKDASGRLIAKVLMTAEGDKNGSVLLETAGIDVDELKRRRTRGRSHDVTTAELLSRLQDLE